MDRAASTDETADIVIFPWFGENIADFCGRMESIAKLSYQQWVRGVFNGVELVCGPGSRQGVALAAFQRDRWVVSLDQLLARKRRFQSILAGVDDQIAALQSAEARRRVAEADNINQQAEADKINQQQAALTLP